MPVMTPTTTPTTRTRTRWRPPSSQDSALDKMSARVSDRPVVATPKSPMPIASHGVRVCWSNAPSISVASDPVIPASPATESMVEKRPIRPTAPTTSRRRGTKNRKSRSASALPSSVPAACLSRS